MNPTKNELPEIAMTRRKQTLAGLAALALAAALWISFLQDQFLGSTSRPVSPPRPANWLPAKCNLGLIHNPDSRTWPKLCFQNANGVLSLFHRKDFHPIHFQPNIQTAPTSHHGKDKMPKP